MYKHAMLVEQTAERWSAITFYVNSSVIQHNFTHLVAIFNDVLCTTVLAKLLNIISTAKLIFRAVSYFTGF